MRDQVAELAVGDPRLAYGTGEVDVLDDAL
jgi:hypothetical protein